MGLFGSKSTKVSKGAKGPEGNVLPNWNTDPISSQHYLAQTPPGLLPLAQQVIERAGRGAPHIALERLYMMVGFLTDSYASQRPELRDHDFNAVRNQLFTRPDFDDSMLFSSLTYFGVVGVALNNHLIQQIPAFVEALDLAAREGKLDG